MAYLPTDEEELQKQNAAAQTSNQTSVLAGNSATQGQAGAVSNGSGYVNLNKYLKANDQQGAGLAGVVTEGAGKTVAEAKTNAVGWGDTAKQNVSKGIVGVDQGLVTQIQSDPTQVGTSYSAYQAKQYGGPQDGKADTGYQTILGQFNLAGEKVNKVTDRTTQKGILQDASVSQPSSLGLQQGQRYTNGFSNLDSFILNADTAGQKALGDFKQSQAGFESALQDQVGNVNQSIAQARAQSDANKQQVRQAVYDTRANTYAGIDSQLESRGNDLYNTAITDAKALIDQQIGTYGTDADRMRLEVLPNGIAGQPTYVTKSGQVTRGAVMTAQERARLQALAALETADVEGPAANPYTFDKTSFDKEMASAVKIVSDQRLAQQKKNQAQAQADQAYTDAQDHRTTTERTRDNWTPSNAPSVPKPQTDPRKW